MLTLMVNQLSQGYQSMLALSDGFRSQAWLLVIRMRFMRHGAIWPQILGQSPSWSDWTSSGIADDVRRRFGPQPILSAPAIMLVDEIDLHLHPTWQQRVLGDLMRTFHSPSSSSPPTAPDTNDGQPRETLDPSNRGKRHRGQQDRTSAPWRTNPVMP